jgi:hypothetical protein
VCLCLCLGLCQCVCVCVYVYVCVYIYSVCICVRVRVCTVAWIGVPIDICVDIYRHIDTCVNLQKYVTTLNYYVERHACTRSVEASLRRSVEALARAPLLPSSICYPSRHEPCRSCTRVTCACFTHTYVRTCVRYVLPSTCVPKPLNRIPHMHTAYRIYMHMRHTFRHTDVV